MKTYLDCVPCFFKQALEAARIAGADKTAQRKILNEVSKLIPDFRLETSPPEMGKTIYGLVAKITGVRDPFKEIKEKSNKLALELYPKLKRKVENSKDSLLTAVELAIAGNIIDYGVKNNLDIEKELKKIFAEDEKIITKESKAIFDYQEFKEALNNAKEIIYLADNAGEVVFDKILIEELVQKRKKLIIYIVKDTPVINDALMEDAIVCGIDEHAQIMSSGSDAPGTVLKFCSPEFLKLYESSEMIISKGQGNFEALSNENKPIFFLFKAKCPVIAKDINGNLGDVVLKSNFKKRKSV